MDRPEKNTNRTEVSQDQLRQFAKKCYRRKTCSLQDVCLIVGGVLVVLEILLSLPLLLMIGRVSNGMILGTILFPVAVSSCILLAFIYSFISNMMKSARDKRIIDSGMVNVIVKSYHKDVDFDNVRLVVEYSAEMEPLRIAGFDLRRNGLGGNPSVSIGTIDSMCKELIGNFESLRFRNISENGVYRNLFCREVLERADQIDISSVRIGLEQATECKNKYADAFEGVDFNFKIGILRKEQTRLPKPKDEINMEELEERNVPFHSVVDCDL